MSQFLRRRGRGGEENEEEEENEKKRRRISTWGVWKRGIKREERMLKEVVKTEERMKI